MNASDRVGGIEIDVSEEGVDALPVEGGEAGNSTLETASHDVPSITPDMVESVASTEPETIPVSSAKMETVSISELPEASNDTSEEAIIEQPGDTADPTETTPEMTPEIAAIPDEPVQEEPSSLVVAEAEPAAMTKATEEISSSEVEAVSDAKEDASESMEDVPTQDQLEDQPTAGEVETMVVAEKPNGMIPEDLAEKISETAANDAEEMKTANDEVFGELSPEEAAKLTEDGAEAVGEDSEAMSEAAEKMEKKDVDPQQWVTALFAQYLLIKGLEGKGRDVLSQRELFRRMMEEREKALEAKVRQTQTFEELDDVLEDEEIIVNSKGERPPFFRAEELMDMIEDARAGNESADAFPEVSGIREQIGTFLERADAEEEARQKEEEEEEARLEARKEEQREQERQLKKAA